MTSTDFENVVSGVWVVAVLGAFGLALAEVSRPPGRPLVRGLLFLGLVAGFAALQLVALLFVLSLIYCENCSGRPLTARDVAAGLVLLAPAAIVWGVVLSWRARRRHNRMHRPPPA